MTDQVKDLQIGDEIAIELSPGNWIMGTVEEIGIDATTGVHWSDVLVDPETDAGEDNRIIRIVGNTKSDLE